MASFFLHRFCAKQLIHLLQMLNLVVPCKLEITIPLSYGWLVLGHVLHYNYDTVYDYLMDSNLVHRLLMIAKDRNLHIYNKKCENCDLVQLLALFHLLLVQVKLEICRKNNVVQIFCNKNKLRNRHELMTTR
jgi:hypothetical protein